MNPSKPDAVWRQIESLLDAAMVNLSDQNASLRRELAGSRASAPEVAHAVATKSVATSAGSRSEE